MISRALALALLAFAPLVGLSAEDAKTSWQTWHANELRSFSSSSQSFFRIRDSVRLRKNESAYLDLSPQSARKWTWNLVPDSRHRLEVKFDGQQLSLLPPTGATLDLMKQKEWKSPNGLLVARPGGLRPDFAYVFLYDAKHSKFEKSLVPYFPFNPQAVVHAQLVRPNEEKAVVFQTSGGNSREYRLYGKAKFSFAGKELSLDLFAPEKGEVKSLFLPFKDQTNGKSTYGGGRYTEVEFDASKPKALIIDFNRAYNPYCAYSHYFDCPLIVGNELEVEMRAGAKIPPRKID